MGKINFQFHALNDEIIDVIKNSLYKNNLILVTIQLFPKFSYELISKEKFKDELLSIKNSRMLILYNYQPDNSINDYDNFLNQNIDGLIFELGDHKADFLKESRISTITNDIETLKMWRQIIKNFKKDMLKGAWVVNPSNKAKEFYNNHYFSLGAKREFDKGTKILPSVGWVEYQLNG